MKTFKNKLLFLSILFYVGLTFSAVSQQQRDMLEQLPPDARASILEKMETQESLTEEIEEAFEEGSSLIIRPENDNNAREDEECPSCIFGYSFFQYSPTTFAPVSNTPVPADYILGPGDKLTINLYGSTNRKVDSFITREGTVLIPTLGPVTLVGMKYNDAINFVKEKVNTELPGTEVSVSLKEIRSINIYVLGQAYKPGKYTVSGLSTLSNALFVSGGVNKFGSLRNINLNRNDELYTNYDFYELLLRGKKNSDIRLQDGDVIFIPIYRK